MSADHAQRKWLEHKEKTLEEEELATWPEHLVEHFFVVVSSRICRASNTWKWKQLLRAHLWFGGGGLVMAGAMGMGTAFEQANNGPPSCQHVGPTHVLLFDCAGPSSRHRDHRDHGGSAGWVLRGNRQRLHACRTFCCMEGPGELLGSRVQERVLFGGLVLQLVHHACLIED